MLHYEDDKAPVCIFCYNKTQMFEGCTKATCHQNFTFHYSAEQVTHIPSRLFSNSAKTEALQKHHSNYPTTKSPIISKPCTINSIKCNILERFEHRKISTTSQHDSIFPIRLCKLLKSIHVVKKILCNI